MATDTIDIFASDLQPMQVWAQRAEDKLAKWAAGQVDGRSTGFVTLDPYMRLLDTELTLIAARPSQGKTAFAMQVAENVAKQMEKDNEPGCVAVFSAEMAGTELLIRMASASCAVNSHKLRNGKGTPAEYHQMGEAIRKLRNLPIWIDDGSAPTTDTMLQRLAQLQETMPIRAMMFDFVELGGDRAPNEELRISGIMQKLKAIAKTLTIPVLALNQLSRDVEKRANKMPQLSDLRYSGMAEQIADKVLFIMRPEYYIERKDNIEVPAEDRTGVAYMMVAKNRNGPVGLVKMAFIKEHARFGDLSRQELHR